jgi:hypothetical protein
MRLTGRVICSEVSGFLPCSLCGTISASETHQCKAAEEAIVRENVTPNAVWWDPFVGALIPLNRKEKDLFTFFCKLN